MKKELINNEREFSLQNNIDIQSNSSTLDTGLDKSRVAVILAYFNGQTYVEDQLISINNQTYPATQIYIYDDNSKNKFTLKGIDLEQDFFSKINIIHRIINLGFAENNLRALESIPDDFEYFAFSDQDDIWNEDKLKVAIAALEKIDPDIPALYCARTEIVDNTGGVSFGYSPLFKKKPSFANALIQNIGGGNTMVLNKMARKLVVRASKDVIVATHDWWCYQVITGAGGQVIYDPKPCLRYRQHEHNIIGENMSWGARVLRIYQLLRGDFKERNNVNISALSANMDLLTASNQELLDKFMQARQSSLLKRLVLFKQSGIYRQNLFGNLGLILGVLLNKV